ncbi:MAG: hypothetical protein FJX25_10250 [Alphaproteobacteria bacterium]|nr:hypothetical protein [Alphaproteobacteria bacterium]
MNDMTQTPGTGLMLPAGTDLQALFRDTSKVDPLIERIEAEVRAHVPDTSTAKGRDAIKSLAYKVSRSKTALDDAGKTLNEEARAQINLVDGARKRIRDRLDALRDEARKPLTEWEEAEAARQTRDKAIEAELRDHGMTGQETSALILATAMRIKAIALPDDFGRDRDAAEAIRTGTMTALRVMYEATQQRERDAAELEKLRREAAERAAADEAVRIERERVEAERLAAERAEQERKDAEARAAREAEERAAREKAEADRIETARKEAAEKAAAEAEARHQRELAEAKRREEEAAQRERDRIAAEQRAEAEAQRKREESARIRNRVRREIAAALAALPQPLTPDAVAEALVAGSIPNTTVRF